MEVAVVPVRVVEHAFDLVVHVVPVRDGGRATVVTLTALDGSADGRAPAVHVEPMLVLVVEVTGVKMAVVQVVDVVPVPHRSVAAARSVLVLVGMLAAAHVQCDDALAGGSPGQ